MNTRAVQFRNRKFSAWRTPFRSRIPFGITGKTIRCILFVSCLLILSCAGLRAQTVIVEWNFPNNPDNAVADGGIPANATKVITTQGGAGAPVFDHDGLTTRCVAADHWSNGAFQKYWLIEFSTEGYSALTVESQMHSHTAGDFGPRDFLVQYMVGSTGTWTTFATIEIDPGNQWHPFPPTSLPAVCNNQPSVSVRWLMASNVPTQGSGLVNDFAFSRMDDVAVRSACVLPAPAGPITGPTSVCRGQGGVVYTVAPISLATSYSWSYSGTGVTLTGSSNSVTLSFSATATSGLLTVFGINACGNGNPSPGLFINVHPVPTVSAAPASQTICPGAPIQPIVISNPNGISGTTFSWVRNNTTVLTGIPASGTANPISGTLSSSSPQTMQTTVFTITAAANGCSSSTTASVGVTDNSPPVFLSAPSPVHWCVQDIVQAFWLAGDITPIRPDWYTFTAGGTTFDLNVSTFQDNCTPAGSLVLHWSILFAGGATLSGTGQISAYPSNIVFPLGTSVITYWLEDQSGNLTPVSGRPQVMVLVHPRPSITRNF